LVNIPITALVVFVFGPLRQSHDRLYLRLPEPRYVLSPACSDRVLIALLTAGMEYLYPFARADKETMMKFAFAHNNFNVLDLDKSLKFYKDALGLSETRRINAEDGGFTLVFLGDGETPHKLELTWLKERRKKYDLGDNEFHVALTTGDLKAAFELHTKMNCVCYVNKAMGIYFIEDPDGYWIEILPKKR